MSILLCINSYHFSDLLVHNDARQTDQLLQNKVEVVSESGLVQLDFQMRRLRALIIDN